jgi:TPR repeat protein
VQGGIKQVLLALVFLFGTSIVAVAGDYEDGMAAYDRSNYTAAVAKLKKFTSTDCSKCPSLEKFLLAARKDNPGVSDGDLTEYWSKTYGPGREADIARAQALLGTLYQDGLGVAQNFQQAADWYRKAAEAGDTEAQAKLALMYEAGRGVPQDSEQAAHWFAKAAQAGDVWAQEALGLMYSDGRGVQQNYIQASHWFTKAAEAGHAWAQFFLARMYDQGQGGPKDDTQAVIWYRKAADQGLAEAQLNLGRKYANGQGITKNDQEAVQWYRKAAEQGLVTAQFILGARYANGQGVPQDYVQSVEWYRKAAEQGDADAQFSLALRYTNGQGVPQDYIQAVQWYRKAAEQGNADAQNNLGFMYSNGQGVPQDYVQGHQWLNLAAASGNSYAPQNRDLLARKMTPSQLAEAQRLAREWKPTTGTVPDRPQETRESKPAASSTGFVVSRQGHVLTNHHVIEGCRTLRATTEGRTKTLTIVGSDEKNDLAVLKLPTPGFSVARFREGRNVRSGDGVVVVGFPLHGLLASEANVTTGTVSALAGMGNDTRFLQITAPVQPGNSGGPLLDQSGNIVGMVVSKLDTMKIAKATGDIPQNINFAINGTVARTFLDSQSVEYEISASSKIVGTAEIGATAKKFTLLLECYR